MFNLFVSFSCADPLLRLPSKWAISVPSTKSGKTTAKSVDTTMAD